MAAADAHGNCQEFGHIHFYKTRKDAHHIQNIAVFEKASQEADDNDDSNCHEAKSLLNVSPFPAAVFNFELSKFEFIFDLVFNLENQFDIPYLEPLRRPPRIA